jgi:YesN/AraC family two-component response regulator
MVVELGEVTIKENISREKHELLKMALSKSGLELMDDKKIVLFEKIKHAIIEMSHYLDELHEINLCDYLSKKLNRDYTCLAGLFSAVQGTTIENYVIAQKIERAKELLIHNELSVLLILPIN